MKLRFLIFFLAIFVFSADVYANNLCLKTGYTVLTVNGIFTDKQDAIKNTLALGQKFNGSYNNQKLTVDFLYNQTHLAGFGDLIDAVQQGLFDQKSDYDLVEMLNDASQKITTQKLLVVGHSQGNFYANNFYDKVASVPGGVPSESIGVYGVASPADRVAGGGKYLTSDTDSVIAATVGRFLTILSPNIHIPLQSIDGNGHSFSNVYLKYQGARIVSDIKFSLDKLQTNDIQDVQKPCIDPPKLSILHKAKGVILAVADPLASFTKTVATGAVIGAYNTSLVIGNIIIFPYILTANLAYNTANSFYSFTQSLFNNKSLAVNNTASAISAVSQPDDVSQNFISETVKENFKPVEKSLTQVNVITEEIPQSEVVLVQSLPQTIQEIPTVEIVVVPGSGGRSSASPPLDAISPIISVVGDNPEEITKNDTYTDAGATALDNIDGVVSVLSSGIVDTTLVGIYTITYTAKDLSNNIATATRTVNVVEPPDTTSPVITILGDNPASVYVGSVYTDAGATALDDVDGTVSVSPSGTVDTATIGTYIITYTASDIVGNDATLTRTVNVIVRPAPYFENSQSSLSDSISTGRFFYCANISSGIADLLTFGSIFDVSSGGVYLDNIGVRGIAGSGTVTSASLKIYPYTGTGGFHSALLFGGSHNLHFDSLVATSDIFNPSTWSSAISSGTVPSDFPYDYITFPHVFLPEGNYFMTFGDCASGTSDYFGVKGSGSGFSQGMQGLFNYNSPASGGAIWSHMGGFGFDYVINGSF